MATLTNGKLAGKKVTQKIFPKLHKGVLAAVNAIVVHQTGAPSAQHTFNSYSNANANGAHFLIDKNGDIYQTALITQKTYHVGKLQSRCLQVKACSPEELTVATNILYAKGQSFAARVRNLHKHEQAKPYPDRYPSNNDSIGIEIVGEFSKPANAYAQVNAKQNASLKWLVSELESLLSLTSDDIYRHPEASRKHATEASTAQW
ncbi:MAG: N-acetylmuramoyl-L-alanine amidase [Alteromonadaceae bacterium]|nr:MAG: N-acetylmuramoyl-L-alanine amidase [Alteromonadaceae bacterium]